MEVSQPAWSGVAPGCALRGGAGGGGSWMEISCRPAQHSTAEGPDVVVGSSPAPGRAPESPSQGAPSPRTRRDHLARSGVGMGWDAGRRQASSVGIGEEGKQPLDASRETALCSTLPRSLCSVSQGPSSVTLTRAGAASREGMARYPTLKTELGSQKPILLHLTMD